jgi:sigma-B regulation protein RsbU (phosphoserine phosphatase)
MLRDFTEKFKRELDEARAIQQSLLPKTLPHDPRFEIAALYEPLEEVGGDWFYIDQSSSGKLRVQIADVTGHGLSAAFIGSMTKLAMMAAGEEAPAALLTRMNALMAAQIPEGKFVTMFSYALDPVSGALRYARAGHPQGLLFRAETGEVEELHGEGFPVGFFEDSHYEEREAQLSSGDFIVVLTDCIPEAQNMGGETYGFERLRESLIRVGKTAKTPSEVIAKLVDDFENFRAGRILKDDVTLIVLRYQGAVA